MKIHGDIPSRLTGAAEQLGQVTDKAAAQKKGEAAQKGADQLTLSPEAKLMKALAEQTGGAPTVRQEVVDRMKELLDKGAVGNDAARLADSIIDDWLKTS